MPSHVKPKCSIVILGGGYAGLTLAQRLGKQQCGAAITLIDAKPAFDERIRLHQVAVGQTIASHDYRAFLAPLGLEFVQARVTRLDPAAAKLTIQHEGGGITSVSYDYLVYALGSSMKVDAVPGVREHAKTYQSVDSATRIHAVLRQAPRSRVLVVGAGLTGIETATELADSMPGLRVTLAINQPWQAKTVPGGFHKKASLAIDRALTQRRISQQVMQVSALRAGMAELSDGQEVPFDTCIWTSGFAPLPLARVAGLQVNAHGQIVTDACLRSLSHPNIIAIGDAAQASSIDSGACRMGSATALAMATSGARTLRALLVGKAPPEFRFVYLFRNLSFGRHDGVVQFVDRFDVPLGIVWTGKKAAAWKEYICLSTLSTMGLRPAAQLPALPPVRTLPQLLRGMGQYA